MAVQASPQHMQTSLPPEPYAIDASSSRRHYQQQSPAVDSYSSSPSQGSRRPSKRPSGNAAQVAGSPSTPQQSQYQSPTASHSSTARTTRAATTRPSPDVSGTVTSSPHQSSQREQLDDQDQFNGPIPPPRTSSNQRGITGPSQSGIVVSDRMMPSVRRENNDQGTSSPATGRQYDSQQGGRSAHLGDHHSRSEPTQLRDDPITTPSSATRSRRRGPTSPEGQRQSPSEMQNRSTTNVQVPTPPNKLAREDSDIIKRVVVTDPVIDLEREKERLAETIPIRSGSGVTPITGLGLVGSEGVDDGGRGGTGRSRQDYSASAARRKETKFGEYILGQTLGEGEFGKVKLGWKKDGSVQVAIKLIRRENLNTNPSRLPKIYREISILRGLSHPNIVRLHEMVETDRHIGIILEYASGGELFDYILTHRYLKDPAARRLFAQLVSGVGYLHKKGIVHRDLKLENLLLDRNRNIIITDFGFANTFNANDELGEEIEYNLTNREFVKRMDLERIHNGVRRGDLMQTSCGSPCYAAPELVVTDSLYTGRKVDVWSCGVILYAMLAGYLPFDDDPANPEGDNINLLYKYIVSTPLTFPEYVTPHARDLLRRILVPDPRKRADLFEVARHSWLSDFAHVVAHVTSSTTTVGEISNVTITQDWEANTQKEDHQDTPHLARSASVREPSKPPVATMSPVGGLSHQGKLDPESADKKAPRDGKRRTVQVEYVAPSSQTTRGELSPPIASTPQRTSPSAAQASLRAANSIDTPRQSSAANSARKPLPQEPPVSQNERQPSAYETPSVSNRTHQRPVTSSMQPPARPVRDIPRSVSDSTNAFGQATARPNTSGSMASTGGGKLSSRGNSYSQPVAPTVAVTNAQGKLAQPKNGRQYNISAPIPQPEPYISDSAITRQNTQPVPIRNNEPSQQRDEHKSHKRSNTLGSVFRSGSIFGRSQPQPSQDASRQQSEKKYPPTSMKAPIANDSPRQSTDSRRPSFSFGRKNSDLGKQEKQDKPRRFSLLPASFSFKSLSGSSQKDFGFDNSRERKGSTSQQQQPIILGGYTQANNYGNMSQSEDNMRVYDGMGDRGQISAPQSRRGDIPPRSASQMPPSSQWITGQQLDPPSRPLPPGQSYYINNDSAPTDSDTSIPRQSQSRRPRYPEEFNRFDQDPIPSAQHGNRSRGPGVLQKNNRKFADGYDQDHAGSSGPAKRVMDFFRRRGKARQGGE